MRGFRWSALLTCALAAASPAGAQSAAPVFDRLHGDWHGEGSLMGRAARFDMSWERRDGFAFLSFANAFADTSGRVTPVLRAAAVYRTSPARPEGVWLDSRGVRVEIRWESSDSALVAYWTAPTETGRTTYRVRGVDELEVVDEVLSDSGWRPFGTARYQRLRSQGTRVIPR